MTQTTPEISSQIASAKVPKIWLSGREISIPEVLDAREDRWQRQQELLLQASGALICLTLNIPGPKKTFPLAKKTLEAASDAILGILAAHDCAVTHKEYRYPSAGYEAYFLTTERPNIVKEWMVPIEDSHPLGRIFDIDVLDPSGKKSSRTDLKLPERTCLLCDNPAFICSRSRRHSVEVLFGREISLMKAYFWDMLSRKIAGLFTKALTYEVTTTPKPGLVDRWHNGAHKDMNIGLFMDSIEALFPYFKECSLFGALWEASPSPALFSRLRNLGKGAEQTMYQATGNVNTHKGLIFSGGILCAAAAHTYVQKMEFHFETIAAVCRDLLLELSDDFKKPAAQTFQTAGMFLFQRYGLTGIRGEAMNGYPTLFTTGWDTFTSCRNLGFSLYKCARITLLYLIAYSQDTNIITRSDYSTWRLLTDKLQEYLKQTPLKELPEEDIIQKLDAFFLEKNISPGGSADLLALVYFLYFLKQ